MPDSPNSYYAFSEIYISIPSMAILQQQYEDWEREQQRAKELEEDKLKYPLLFLKDGIV